MMARRGIAQPHPQSRAKHIQHHRIAARIWISNNLSNGVEWDVIDAKSPYKVLNVFHMLLMRLRCKDGLEEPSPILNLANVANGLEGSSGFTHYQNFLWAVLNFPNRDRLHVAIVNNPFVILHWDKYPTVV